MNLIEVLKENDKLSLTRVLSFLSFIFFIVVSIYLLITNKPWIHYETFAYITCGGALGTQIANKVSNNKYKNGSKNTDG